MSWILEKLGYQQLNIDRLAKTAEKKQQQARSLRIARRNSEAALTFRESAQIFKQIGMDFEASQCVQEALVCSKSANDKEELINMLIDFWLHNGNFDAASRLALQLADLHKNDVNTQKEIDALEKAIEWGSGTNYKSKRRLAVLAAEKEDYFQAAELFLQIGDPTSACICRLANDDEVGARLLLPDIPSFMSGYKLIDGILQAKNVEEFTDCVTEFDKSKKMENWQVTALLKLKRGFATEVEHSLC